jgi:hypothetical protein
MKEYWNDDLMVMAPEYVNTPVGRFIASTRENGSGSSGEQFRA